MELQLSNFPLSAVSALKQTGLGASLCNSKSERIRVINEGSNQESESSVDHLDDMFNLQVID